MGYFILNGLQSFPTIHLISQDGYIKYANGHWCCICGYIVHDWRIHGQCWWIKPLYNCAVVESMVQFVRCWKFTICGHQLTRCILWLRLWPRLLFLHLWPRIELVHFMLVEMRWMFNKMFCTKKKNLNG